MFTSRSVFSWIIFLTQFLSNVFLFFFSIAKAHFKDQETAFFKDIFLPACCFFVMNEFCEFKFIWFVQAGLDRHLRGHGF